MIPDNAFSFLSICPTTSELYPGWVSPSDQLFMGLQLMRVLEVYVLWFLNSSFSETLCCWKSNIENPKKETAFSVLLSFNSCFVSSQLSSMQLMCCLHKRLAELVLCGVFYVSCLGLLPTRGFLCGTCLSLTLASQGEAAPALIFVAQDRMF